MCAKYKTLEEIAKYGYLKNHVNKYIQSCRPPPDSDKRTCGKFPNIAGFCRFLGCGIDEFEALRLTHPDAVGYIHTVLEDEALNSQAFSPTLATAYLKRRLGYADRSEAVSSANCGEMRLIFEHDIEEDGA